MLQKYRKKTKNTKKIEKWGELTEEQQKQIEVELLKEFEEMGSKMERDLQEFYNSGYLFPSNINVDDLTLEKKWDTAMKIMGKNEVKLEKGASFRRYDTRKNKYTDKVSYNMQGRFQGKNKKKLDAVIEEKFTDEDNKNAITKQTVLEYTQQKGEPVQKQITQTVKITKITTQKELLGDFYKSSSQEDIGSEEKLENEEIKKIGEKILAKKTDLFDYLEKKQQENKKKGSLKTKSKKGKKNKKGKMLIELIDEKEQMEMEKEQKEKEEKEKKEKEEKENEILIALYKNPERQKHDVLCKFYLQGKKCPIGKDCPFLHNIRALKDVSCLNKNCAKVNFVSDGVYKNFSDNVRDICPYRHFQETEASYEKRVEPLKNDIYKKRDENKKKKKEKNRKSKKSVKGKKAVSKVMRKSSSSKGTVIIKSPSPKPLLKNKSPSPKPILKNKSPSPKPILKNKSPILKNKSPSRPKRTFDKEIFTNGARCVIKKKNL